MLCAMSTERTRRGLCHDPYDETKKNRGRGRTSWITWYPSDAHDCARLNHHDLHRLHVTMAPLASTITTSEFAQLLTRYSNAIIAATRPNAKLEPVATLDSWRRTELPATIASRSPPHMTKAELYRLVDCKLYSTFRPPTSRSSQLAN